MRNFIVKGLYEFLQVPVIPTDNPNKKPKYPFISYKFTTLHKNQGGFNLLLEPIPSIDPNFEYDIEYTREEQPKMVISFSSYSLDDLEAIDLANKIKKWFNFKGRLLLKNNNLVVVECSDIQDRTIQIIDNYEKRYGFDVTLRYSSQSKLKVETIEKFKIKGGKV
ncbi:hypothetical protein SAMN00017405_0390 [Desulfonispora thiosulfatigenes DSM 11270]|uniref:Phage neck terminator protein gp12-like domain-containing protein n=2 Tax=Desulfonispora thiosulfatigenes TaxID=83661 RepID=A0A1W1VPR0_DESTI|nr:hypothetical protein SAMN00017405_0390 [Desulfonispora thiosulfatigenes DSM 11270]